MNTLNYKVLLVRNGLMVFGRAIGIYLLLTLPAAALFPMYLVSAAYAVSFGWIAAAFFVLVLYLLHLLKISIVIKKITLYATVGVAVAIAFHAIELTGLQAGVWQSGPFLLFPGAAVLAGWISLLAWHGSIYSLLTCHENTGVGIIPDNSTTTPPQHI